MHLDRLPSRGYGSLIERFRLLGKKGGSGHSTLELAADCHFGLGFMLWDTGSCVFAGGPNTEAYVAAARRSVEYLFIRFRPGRMPRLLDVAPADMVNATVEPVRRLLGVDTDGLCERLRAAKTLAAKQEILEELLRPSLVKPLCQDRRCVRALEMIEAFQGQLRVSDVSGELGINPRTLRRMFLDQVGMTPKSFVCRLRLQKAVERIERAPLAANLADLALECGYADQSHLIHEFRALARKLPTEFLAKRNPATREVQLGFRKGGGLG